MTKISVCIIANKLFPRVYDTLNSYRHCDEILLGFNGNADELATFRFPDIPNLNIVTQKWQGYGATKNELASMAKNNWILSVDSDEVADEILQHALQQFCPADVHEIYTLRMQHYLGNIPVKHGAWGKGKSRFERLYNRQHTAWDQAAVHETVQLKVNSHVVPLVGTIWHYTAENIGQFREKNEYYARLSAQKYYVAGKKATLLKRFISPVFTFVKQYIFQLGLLDGTGGFNIAKGNAWYTFRKYQLLHEMKSRAV